MTNTPATQIDNIHAMLDSGHHSVRIEKHTFLIWGLGGAAVVLFMEWFGAQEFLKTYWQNNIAIYAIGAGALSIIAFLDHRKTRDIRKERAESVSFTQAQLIKLWWVAVGLCILTGFGMAFMDLALLTYPISLLIFGAVFYTHGLFSRQPLSLSGVLMVVAAVIGISLAVSKVLPYMTLQYLGISVFGIGLPLFAFLTDEPKRFSTALGKTGFSLGWLMTVFLPVFLVHFIAGQVSTPTGMVIVLSDFTANKAQYSKGRYIVRIPSGTKVPLMVSLEGKSLALDGNAPIAAHVTADIQVSLKDGKPDGRVKAGDAGWTDWDKRGWPLWLKDVKAELTSEKGPHAVLKLFANF